MFIPDMPNVPPQNVPVMIAQANQAQQSDTRIRAIGVCVPAPNNNYSGQNGIDPKSMAARYLRDYEHQKIANTAPGTITFLQQPAHGILRLITEADRGTFFSDTSGPIDPADPGYAYLPEEGYLGKDKAVALVEIGGVKVKVVFYFQAVNEAIPDYDTLCKKGYRWKISSTLDASNNLTVTSVDYQPDLTRYATTLGIDTSSVTVTFADLPSGALGQTTGSSITLDTNAAGNNWYIDATPGDNAEYLPTSNPFEWIAKAGSAAAGKMDLLTVLLHEYGHALGIDHNPDAHDYMGTTLTAGVRRLPTADEMALMQQLVAQAKNGLATTDLPSNVPAPFPTLPFSLGGLAFAGLLRPNRYGGLNAVLDNSTLTQYAVAANSTLTNGNLSSTPSTGSGQAGWATQGSVTFTPATVSGTSGVATLNEISTSQTRLSQVFMVNANDRYLSFTLSGTALDNMNGAPDDAFEVALLNANTGASLLSSNGLTHSDAFLNLQADGTEYLSQGITRINNPDGSRTYRIDLSGVASGTAVNLSFDLIGFGANPVLSGVEGGSHVNISDVRLSGLPQLHDDAATILEDGTLSFNPYAQIPSPSGGGLGWGSVFTSTVVNAPAHGAVTMNADGTFSYTPTLNYNGADSFTYRLNDGALQSNLATVSLTLTAVNDAPVAADVALTTAEDTALVITLSGYATDVDSTVLTPTIVTNPSHGVLIANADGTFSYTPDLNYNGADSFTYQVNDGALDSNLATVSLNVTAVNDAPVATNATVTTLEDTARVIDLRTYASDVDSTVLTATIITAPLHGALVQNVDGTFSYTPDLNYNGTDSFTYRLNNGALQSNPAAPCNLFVLDQQRGIHKFLEASLF